jgi:hypothetical protein
MHNQIREKKVRQCTSNNNPKIKTTTINMLLSNKASNRTRSRRGGGGNSRISNTENREVVKEVVEVCGGSSDVV